MSFQYFNCVMFWSYVSFYSLKLGATDEVALCNIHSISCSTPCSCESLSANSVQ